MSLENASVSSGDKMEMRLRGKKKRGIVCCGQLEMLLLCGQMTPWNREKRPFALQPKQQILKSIDRLEVRFTDQEEYHILFYI